MKNLLENDFINHHCPTARATVNVVSINDVDFDLDDKAALVCSPGSGVAKYSNPNRREVNVVNYESFINSLPTRFKEKRKKCDLIVYTSDFSFFLLNELTETNPQYVPDFIQPIDGLRRIGKRNHAISQLKQTLEDISEVSAIDTFIKKHKTKHCCFFNKPQLPPIGSSITAPVSFNSLSLITPYGIHTRNSDIESYGFEFWEFSTPQTYLLSFSVRNIAERLSKLSTKEVKELAEIIKQYFDNK